MTGQATAAEQAGPVLPDGAVVSHPYVSYEGGTRVLVVAAGGESWFRVEAWEYAVQRWYWEANRATLRGLAEFVRPHELVDADSGELWGNVDISLPAYIRRARLSCAGRPLALRVADGEQIGAGTDPYAPKGGAL